jgi:hypothetical protein
MQIMYVTSVPVCQYERWCTDGLQRGAGRHPRVARR